MPDSLITSPNYGIDELIAQLSTWVSADLLTTQTLLQLGLILLAALLARVVTPRLKNASTKAIERYRGYPVMRLFQVVHEVAYPLTWLFFQFLIIVIPRSLNMADKILVITTSLLSAWVVIRIVSSSVSNPMWSKSIAVVAWIVAALNILGLLDETTAAMEQIGFGLGEVRLTLMGAFEGVVTLAVLLWVAVYAAQLIERQLKASPNLTPSIQVLSAKLLRMALVAFAFFFSLAIVGIDLTALAVFSGAIGVGLGFGLQKIFGNLISGIILLLDKSIKPGDVIAVPGYYGRVDALGARYVSVLTRDGVEHLIPNEELIINRVENWSHTHNLLRLRSPLGVHYKSDVHKAIALCVEAAIETARILDEPAPNCLVRGFGDSSVDLEVRFWIDDPMNGRANVKGELLISIWDKFHEHGIEIPYPQRDLHLRSSDLETPLGKVAGDD